MKFYTAEGNWDMVGNNRPVFFVRDPYKFGDFIHMQKRDPKTNMRSNTAMWDFRPLSPESLHQVTILMSDRGLPQRDLFEATDRGDYPRWRVCVQVMPEDEAAAYHVNPFDLTKVWPHADYPLIEIGVMELNRNPENYFADIEQAAFEPSNIVPGISFSPDKMLQARIMSYADAQRYLIGVNYASLPANSAQCPVHTYHRDGKLRFDGNNGGAVNYEPNSMGGPVDDARYNEPPLKVSGDASRYDHRDGNDDYTQPGNLFRLMSDGQQQALFSNIAAAMAGVPERIVARQLAHFYRADRAYGRGVAELLDMDIEGIAGLAELSLAELIEMTSEEGYAGARARTELPLAKA